MNQLAWSKMTGKMDGIPALNTDTTTNKFCIAKSKDANSICSKCYSWNMLKTFRKNAVPRFQLNSKLLSEKVLDFNELPRPNSNTARFNAHGELINTNHVQNLVNYALFYPKVTFTLWTKKKGLIQSFFNKCDKPKNLLLIYSNETLELIPDIIKGGAEQSINGPDNTPLMGEDGNEIKLSLDDILNIPV